MVIVESCPNRVKAVKQKLYEMLINDKLNTLMHSHNLLGHVTVVHHERALMNMSIHITI